MVIQIVLGGIRIRLDSDFEIKIDEQISPFISNKKEIEDVEIKIKCDEKECKKPESLMCGEDMFLEYYEQEDKILCMAKGGVDTYLSATISNHAFTRLECHLYIIPESSMRNISSLLRLLPMMLILQKNGGLFFHASQIEMNGKGILFTAPSGTGKTTQAKLWRQYRGAKIICNDRVLCREDRTYGYPADGSEPIRSAEVFPLGAIVLLKQGSENIIQRLTEKQALLKLFSQLIISFWNAEARVLAVEQLICLVKTHPIYLMQCTPTETAVSCLEKQLKIDGVI